MIWLPHLTWTTVHKWLECLLSLSVGPATDGLRSPCQCWPADPQPWLPKATGLNSCGARPKRLPMQVQKSVSLQPSGLGPIKASNIVKLTRRVWSHDGELSLPYLWPRTTLTKVRTVGREQQDSMLSAGNPSNPGPTRGRLFTVPVYTKWGYFITTTVP